jgi:Lar family restriction alleviation protein
MSELLHCPFCGGSANFEQKGTPRVSCIVACDDCGARLESGDTGSNCGAAWNRRAAGWISVKDRMPSDVTACRIMIYRMVGGIRILRRNKYGYSLPADVTHWMPLPAPPATGEQRNG